MKKLIILFIIIIFIGCNNSTPILGPDIMLLSSDFSELEINSITKQLEEYWFNEFGTYLQVDNLDDSISLPKRFLKNGRYDAKKLINYYQNNCKYVNILLLKNDIFIVNNKGNNWGILGFSINSGNTCVVSSYRIKNKEDIWKVIIHEYIHNRFGYLHCPNDDPKCLMKDAKGHAVLYNKNTLCNTCKHNIEKRLKYFNLIKTLKKGLLLV